MVQNVIALVVLKRTRKIQTLWRETHIAETSGKLQGKGPFLGVLSNVSNNNRTPILMCKKDDNGPLCDSQLFDCLFCCLIVHFHSLFSSFMHCHHYNVHIFENSNSMQTAVVNLEGPCNGINMSLAVSSPFSSCQTFQY